MTSVPPHTYSATQSFGHLVPKNTTKLKDPPFLFNSEVSFNFLKVEQRSSIDKSMYIKIKMVIIINCILIKQIVVTF